MAMVRRLCPAIGLTPVPSTSASETGPVVDWKTTLKFTQTTQWIYERGLDELQTRAIKVFADIPLKSSELTRVDQVFLPAAYHQVTYLNFDNAQDKVGQCQCCTPCIGSL